MLTVDYKTTKIGRIDTGSEIVGHCMPEVETYIDIYKEGRPDNFLFLLRQHDSSEEDRSIGFDIDTALALITHLAVELPYKQREKAILALSILKGESRFSCECQDCLNTWKIFRKWGAPTSDLDCDFCGSSAVLVVPDEGAPISN